MPEPAVPDPVPSPPPFFSLIVCTLGRREPLARLLRSLRLQGEDDFEVILVDQNPEGWLDPLLGVESGGLQVRLLRSAAGLSRARNVGLAAARGEAIAFPDDDCWYPQGLLSDVRSWLCEHPDVSVLTCPTRDERGSLSNGRFLRTSRFVTRRNVWFSGTSNGLFMRAELVRAVGLFDETLGAGAGTPYGAGEETDFLLRALERGAKARFERNLFVHHDQIPPPCDARGFARAGLYARGFGRVLRLRGYSFFYALYRALRSLAAALGALALGRFGAARLKLIWVAGTLLGYGAPLSAGGGDSSSSSSSSSPLP